MGTFQVEALFFSYLGATANTLFPSSLISVDRREGLWERSEPRTGPATIPYVALGKLSGFMSASARNCHELGSPAQPC